jgi:hypothetical protein
MHKSFLISIFCGTCILFQFFFGFIKTGMISITIYGISIVFYLIVYNYKFYYRMDGDKDINSFTTCNETSSLLENV